MWSTTGVRRYIAARGGNFARFYARFAAGNLTPARSYSEGSHYHGTVRDKTFRLGPRSRHTGARSFSLQHLTNATAGFVPRSGMTSHAWRLRVHVNLPGTFTGSAAFLVVTRTDGSLARVPLRLNSHGDATKTVLFYRGRVVRVTLTLANGSTRFHCLRGTYLTCQGVSLDDGRAYRYSATAFRQG